MSVTVEEQHWWHPDPAVLEAILDGRMGFKDLDPDEESWVVAQMSERGFTTALIAEHLRCSQRQVKRVRARTLTQQMRLVERLTAERDHAEIRRRDAAAHVRLLKHEVEVLRSTQTRRARVEHLQEW